MVKKSEAQQEIELSERSECGVLDVDYSKTNLRVLSGRLFDEPLPNADLVISTLPGGAADPLSSTRWNPGTTVLDVVYAPWPTPFAGSALAAGCRVVSGLTVLLHQAVAQVELMTGRPGPVEVMRTALAAAVAARQG